MSVRVAGRSRGRLWRDMAVLTWDMVAHSPWAGVLLVGVLVVGNATAGIMAAAMGGFVNAAVHTAYHGMALWLGVYVAASLVEQFYWNFKNLAVGYMRDQAIHRLQRRILQRAARVPLGAMQDSAFFDTLQRASANLPDRVHMLQYAVSDLVQLLVSTASLAVVLGLVQPVLLVILAAGTLPGVWLNARVATALYQVQREDTNRSLVRGHVQGLLTGRAAAAEIRLFGAARYLLDHWRTLRAERTRSTLAAEARMGLAATAGNLLTGLAMRPASAWSRWTSSTGDCLSGPTSLSRWRLWALPNAWSASRWSCGVSMSTPNSWAT